MLTVYTYRTEKPPQALDLSSVPLDELADAAVAFYTHQKTGEVWFGYLDGWMITPREEVLLRKVIRKFECSLVTTFPFSLGQSWKNEIKTIYTKDINGAANLNHDGRSLHNGRKVEYR